MTSKVPTQSCKFISISAGAHTCHTGFGNKILPTERKLGNKILPTERKLAPIQTIKDGNFQYLGMENIWPAEEKKNREGKHIGEGKLMTDKQTDNPLMNSIPSAEGVKNK